MSELWLCKNCDTYQTLPLPHRCPRCGFQEFERENEPGGVGESRLQVLYHDKDDYDLPPSPAEREKRQREDDPGKTYETGR